MLAFIAGVVVGGVAVYLVTRNNPKLKAEADKLTDAVEQKIDQKKS